jgi:N-acetyltransferase
LWPDLNNPATYFMHWIEHPVILENQWLRLEPIISSHIDELAAISHAPEIWEFLTFDGMDTDSFKTELKSTILRRTIGDEYTFTIFDKRENRIIGSTRLLNLFQNHRKLEIGWTWYSPDCWGKGQNIACKLLLLTYCFETLKTVRVQFQVNSKNERSRAAVLKIGAIFEGILRNDRIRDNGIIRDTAMFSITNAEWAGVKAVLTKKMEAFIL